MTRPSTPADSPDPGTLAARLWLALAEQGGRVASLERQLAQVRSSRSWRITAPLRALANRLRPAGRTAGAPLEAPGLEAVAGVREGQPPPRLLPDEPQHGPRLLVDVTELALDDLGAGVQRVTRRVLAELLISPPAGRAVTPIRLTPGGRYCHARAFLASFTGAARHSLGPDAPLVPRADDRFLGLDFCRDRSSDLAPAVAALRQAGASACFLVHDMLPLEHPHWFPDGVAERFEKWLRVLGAQADLAICVSRVTADALAAALARRGLASPPSGIVVVTPGCDLWPVPAPPVPPLPERAAGRLRVLTVGTVEPRKGHDQALGAFECLWARGMDIEWVIVGHPGWGEGDLLRRLRNHPEAGRRLHWLEDADDRALAALYGQADLLLAPTRGEGFGLPVAEAGATGLGLLLRDLPVFHEVAGEAATYFRGDSPAAIADALREWRAAGHAGRPTRRWTTWEQSAEQIKAVVAGMAPRATAATNCRSNG